MPILDTVPRGALLAEPPEGYVRTAELAWFLDGMNTPALAQKWVDDVCGWLQVWIVIPTYLLH